MQNNVVDFRTKKEIAPGSHQIARFAGAQKRQLKREIVSSFYDIERCILESPQTEYSEDARQGVISLINYFKYL